MVCKPFKFILFYFFCLLKLIEIKLKERPELDKTFVQCCPDKEFFQLMS